MKHLAGVVVLAALVLAACAPPRSANRTKEPPYIVLGGGNTKGTYYRATNSMCFVFNEQRPSGTGRCLSVSNRRSWLLLYLWRTNGVNMALIHSYHLDRAYRSAGAEESTVQYGQLRSVFSLYGEPLTLIVRADSGIRSLDDLPGKRIHMGKSGTVTRDLTETLLKSKGWTTDDVTEVTDVGSFSERQKVFCDGGYDVLALPVGHPSSYVQELIDCGGVFLPTAGPHLKPVLARDPALSLATIPGDAYGSDVASAETFGYRPVLTVMAKTDAQKVYDLVKAVFENLEEFKGLNPVLKTLRRQEMARASLSIPLHRGARRYLTEIGLVPATPAGGDD